MPAISAGGWEGIDLCKSYNSDLDLGFHSLFPSAATSEVEKVYAHHTSGRSKNGQPHSHHMTAPTTTSCSGVRLDDRPPPETCLGRLEFRFFLQVRSRVKIRQGPAGTSTYTTKSHGVMPGKNTPAPRHPQHFYRHKKQELRCCRSCCGCCGVLQDDLLRDHTNRVYPGDDRRLTRCCSGNEAENCRTRRSHTQAQRSFGLSLAGLHPLNFFSPPLRSFNPLRLPCLLSRKHFQISTGGTTCGHRRVI